MSKVPYEGRVYKSYRELAEAYGVNKDTFRYRRSQGMSIKEALSHEDFRYRNGNHKCQDHEGNWFESEKEMSKYYKIPYCVYKSRKKMGWNLKDRLTRPYKRNKTRNGEEYHEYELEEIALEERKQERIRKNIEYEERNRA